MNIFDKNLNNSSCAWKTFAGTKSTERSILLMSYKKNDLRQAPPNSPSGKGKGQGPPEDHPGKGKGQGERGKQKGRERKPDTSHSLTQ